MPATAAAIRQPNSGAVVIRCPDGELVSASWYPKAHSPSPISHLPSGGCTTYDGPLSL